MTDEERRFLIGVLSHATIERVGSTVTLTFGDEGFARTVAENMRRQFDAWLLVIEMELNG